MGAFASSHATRHPSPPSPAAHHINTSISLAAAASTLASLPQPPKARSILDLKSPQNLLEHGLLLPCQRAAWLRVLTALRDRKTPVQILVMGDSMLAGHGGYAKVFVESLNSQLGFFSVRLINIARGGTSTEAALAVLPALLDESLAPSDHGNTIEPPTILLMDYSINDGCQPKDPSGARLRAALESQIRWLLSNRPSLALLRVESYYSKAAKDLCSNTLNRDYAPITSHYSIPHFIYSKAVKAGQYEAGWSKGCGLRTFDARCSAHPPWETHELISYALTRSFVLFATAFSGGGGPGQAAGCNGGAQWPLERGSNCLAAASSSSSSSFSECGNKQLPPPISPAALLKELSVCTHPKTAYRAHAAFAASSSSATTKPSLPVVFRGDWKLYEDRAGKPGWITTGPTRSTIEFNLTFGAQPSLAFSYLISHDPSYGDVLIRMRNVRPGRGTSSSEWKRASASAMWEVNRVRLSGRRSDGYNASTTEVMHMQVNSWIMQSSEMHLTRYSGSEPLLWSNSFPGIMGFGLPSHAQATMNVELACPDPVVACKFKIVSVVSC